MILVFTLLVSPCIYYSKKSLHNYVVCMSMCTVIEQYLYSSDQSDNTVDKLCTWCQSLWAAYWKLWWIRSSNLFCRRWWCGKAVIFILCHKSCWSEKANFSNLCVFSCASHIFVNGRQYHSQHRFQAIKINFAANIANMRILIFSLLHHRCKSPCQTACNLKTYIYNKSKYSIDLYS